VWNEWATLTCYMYISSFVTLAIHVTPVYTYDFVCQGYIGILNLNNFNKPNETIYLELMIN